MPKNQPRYHRGRSAVARKVMLSAGSTNGMMPQGGMVTWQGEHIGPKRYFGGMKKGGSPPSATGFMRPSGKLSSQITATASRPNFLFRMKTGPGPSPFGFGPHA